MEIDMTYQLKVIQQSLEQEEAEHKTTKARLADKNKIYESIEEAKSEAMKGMHCEVCSHSSVKSVFTFTKYGICLYCQVLGAERKEIIRETLYTSFFFNLCIITTISKKLKPKCKIILPYF